MKRVTTRVGLLVAMVTLIVLATASTAWAFGGAAGDLTYQCPFTDTPVQAQFWAHQTSPAYAGCGHEVISYGVLPDVGRDTVSVAYARVATLPSGVREAYLAGPVVRSTVPGMSSFWWYMAMRDAPGTAHDKIVGHYLKHKDALAAVVNGPWADKLTSITGDLIVWD
jgi:hypothetical protein